MDKFRNNPWSTKTDLAHLLIEFERQIRHNRLDENLLSTLNDWILALLSCDTGNNNDFDKFVTSIDAPKDCIAAIAAPSFFTLCMNALSE